MIQFFLYESVLSLDNILLIPQNFCDDADNVGQLDEKISWWLPLIGGKSVSAAVDRSPGDVRVDW